MIDPYRQTGAAPYITHEKYLCCFDAIFCILNKKD